MKRIITLVLGTLFVGSGLAQSIWTNPITGTNPNAANPYTTGDVVDPNMTASGIGRGTGITGSNANNRYAASGWNSTAIDLNDYFEFTLTPNSGCQINFVSFVYTGQASASGPANIAFRSSVDGYVSNIGTPSVTGTTISLSGASYQGITTPITFRLYGWGASAAGGTFSVNDFTFNGTTSCGAPCTPPATQASGFASSVITNTSGTISWTPGSSGNVIVLVHQGSAVTSDPANAVTYTANSVYGSGTQIGSGNYVVYNGTSTNVNVTGLAPGTTYYFAVYEYNPNAGSPCYLLTELTGSFTTTGAAATCFEIESILVDGCDGGNEGKNEMVRFKVGNAPLNVADLSVTWPNAGNSYLGICQDATTAAGVATINATIQACGYIKEPVLGVLPAGAEVILVTSTAFNPLAQSFVNLNDTIYMIFQCAGNTSGHFANYTPGVGIRTLTMSFINPSGCSDAVSYDKAQLTMQNGSIGAQDGAAVEFTANGVATYVNRGCQAPFIPLSVNAGADATICFNGTANLTATGSSQYSSVAWSGGTGTFGSANSLSTTYTPGPGETSGTVSLYVQLNSNCGTFVRDTVVITLNPAPMPTVTSNIASATVCSGSPITLTASGGTSYSWNTSATTNTITVNPTVSTVYTVTVTNACSNTSGTFSVTVNNLPVATASNTGAYCVGEIIQLNATAGFTYNWAGPNSFSSSLQNPTISAASALTAGTYSLTVTDANSCSSSVSTSVVVNSLPIVTSAVPPVVITPANCGSSDGSIVGATASGVNPISYQWYSSTGTALITTSDLTGIIGGTYYLAAIDGNGCRDSVAFTVSTLNGPSIPTFAASPSVCPGSSFSLTVTNPQSGATYTWSAPGGATQTGVNLTTINVSSADATNIGPYSVEVNTGGCSNFASVSATLLTKPSPVITGTTVFCSGSSTVLDASSSLPAVGNSYQWYLGGAPIVGAIASTYTATAAGNYQVLVTDASGCDSLSIATTLTINPLPTITATNATACLNAPLLISASGAVSYTWSTGTSPSSGDTVSVLTSAAGTLTYTVTGTDGNNCSNTAIASVTVNSLPVITSTTPPVTITPASCGSTDGGVSGANATGASPFTYQWTNSSGTVVGNTNTLNGVAGGVYYLTAIDNNTCRDSVPFTVNTLGGPPTPTFNAVAPVCPGGNFALVVSNPVAGADYSWTSSGNPTQSGVDLDSIFITNASASNVGPYTLEMGVAGCSSFATISVTLSSNPLPSVIGATSFCQGTNTVLDASGSLPSSGNTFQWYVGGNPIAGATSATYTATAAGNYEVLVTNSTGCDSLSSPIAITVNPLPLVQVTNAAVCINAPATLTASGANTYAWSSGTSPSVGATVTVPGGGVGSTTFTVTGTDANNCTNTAIATVTVNPNPILNINGMQNGSIQLCPNTDTVFAVAGAQDYVWSTGSNQNFINYTATTNQVLTVIGTDANGCVDSTKITVTMTPGPPAPVITGAPTICNGYATILYVDTIAGQTYSWTNSSGSVISTLDSAVISTPGNYNLVSTSQCGSTTTPITIGQSTIDVSFVPDTLIGLAPLSVQFANTSTNTDYYWWSFGNGDTSVQVSPSTVFNNAGTYTVFLAGSNTAYCYDTYAVQIIVLAQDIFLTVPNVFSPNDDGKNDFFAVKSYGIKTFNCLIYDRWGLLVKELKSVDEKWAPASNVSEGTYFYIVKATGLDNKEFLSQGYVLLVK